jgi:hypothetical protein
MTWLLTLVKVAYYRARLLWAERRDIGYMGDPWLNERLRSRELD